MIISLIKKKKIQSIPILGFRSFGYKGVTKDQWISKIRVLRDSFRREIRVSRDSFRREIRVLRAYERVKKN